MKRLKGFLLLVIIGVLLTACSSGGGGTDQGSPRNETGTRTEGDAGKGEDTGKKITIGLATPAVATAFWVSLYYGVEDEAKKQGVELIALDAGGYDQSSKQIQQILDLIQRKVDAILVGATDGQAIAPVVEQAVDAGIPVVGVSSLPATDKLAVTVGADHYGLGQQQAICLGKKLEGKGQVALMAGPPGVNWAMERVRGFKETLASMFPEMELVAEKQSNSDRTSGRKIMEDWLQAYPDLKGIGSVVDDLGAGAADALASAGKTGSIQIASSNLSAIGQQYLREGKILCESTQQVVLQGRLAVQAAVKLARGEQPAQTKYVTDAVLVYKDDLDTMDMSLISAPNDYKPSIK
ncbi:MAG: substrate-binding domain-containing protein [Hydrogenibacillus sp.]|nr:substrate-binding domain-containing protein [Hydrogenibacillus sp.]